MSSRSALHLAHTSEIHYWAIGVMAVHLTRGSGMLPILGMGSIVGRLDQKKIGASIGPVRQVSSPSSVFNVAVKHTLCMKWMTAGQKYKKMTWSVWKVWITGWGVSLDKIRVFGRSADAVRAGSTNENQWGSEAVRGYPCVRCIWHFTRLLRHILKKSIPNRSKWEVEGRKENSSITYMQTEGWLCGSR